MAKLQDDPKVAALIEKTVAAAVKNENKRVIGLIKESIDNDVATTEDKAAIKLLKSTKKNLVDIVKQ